MLSSSKDLKKMCLWIVWGVVEYKYYNPMHVVWYNIAMKNEKIAEIMKARHATTAPEELTAHAKKMNEARWSRIAPKERTKIAHALVQARTLKNGNGTG